MVVTLPGAFCDQLGFKGGEDVSISLVPKGLLIQRPMPPRRQTAPQKAKE